MFKKRKDILWALDLLNSPFIKKVLIKSTSGCKKDFERCLRISENNKDFTLWFNDMVENGIFEFYEIKIGNKGPPSKGYVINENKLLKWLESSNDSIKKFIKTVISKKSAFGF